MSRHFFRNRITVAVLPSKFHVTDEDVVITTLLGSCVAACLYDPVAGVAGMNHFMLSSDRYARDMPFSVTDAGRYGIHAMELLINGMLRLGARRNEMSAKVFGGASIMTNPATVGNFHCVGSVNCRFIRDFLTKEGIPLVATDLGGDEGRVIYFDTRDYGVSVRKIKKKISLAVAERDRKDWEKSIKAQKELKVYGAIDLWLS